ncbi:MAG TPA: MSMEG_0569 family flavin-dependent oxidoreductase [Streptosporangiaceae bacterium]|jgi:putative flavoprotein involved in K+ transport|nr:MSMEG_0569 family flavin-dependent oxidoreductase [Streptosporangiaceae bacterium]
MPVVSGAHCSVAVVGGGQAGLSMSYCLAERGVDHVVLERERPGHEWRERRWDSFCLVTPNWQCQLPGFPYQGPDPDGFMARDQVVTYLESYAASLRPPLVTGAEVTRLRREPRGAFMLATTAGDLTADRVVIATGPYQLPAIPPAAGRLPDGITQLHSSQYRRPGQLPPGAVLVVGTGQSGCQIAEDLHLAGRQVHLSVGSAPRVARRYRGRDVVAWLHDMGYYDKGIGEFADAESVRLRANHYVTGRDGGHDIDLRAFARDGMRLHGRLVAVTGGRLEFAADLTTNLDRADAVSESIKDSIDAFIDTSGTDAPPGSRYTPVWQPPAGPGPALDLEAAGISAVIWSTGFGRDYRWVDVPVFDGRGYPTHDRGVTNCPGLYFIGLPWLHTWGSGRFSGVGRDARHLVSRIIADQHRTWGDDVRWIAGSPTETHPDRDWSIPRTAVS